jgi:Arm DNA-binding domain
VLLQMERKILTTAAVRALKAGPVKREVRDYAAQGLYLSIQPSGHKSWYLRFRGKDGRPTKLVLGPLDLSGQEMSGDLTVGMPLSLGAARQLANTLHRSRALGDDIIADHKRKKSEPPADTFTSLVEDYLEQHASKTRGCKRTARVLQGVCKEWGGRALTEVTSADVFQLVQDTSAAIS